MPLVPAESRVQRERVLLILEARFPCGTRGMSVPAASDASLLPHLLRMRWCIWARRPRRRLHGDLTC